MVIKQTVLTRIWLINTSRLTVILHFCRLASTAVQADFCVCIPFSTEMCYECLLILTVTVWWLSSIWVFIKTLLGYLHSLELPHRDGTKRHNESLWWGSAGTGRNHSPKQGPCPIKFNCIWLFNSPGPGCSNLNTNFNFSAKQINSSPPPPPQLHPRSNFVLISTTHAVVLFGTH